MQDISISEAYNIWVSGKSLSAYAIWGISIIWLGRIGKILSFFSAITIIAEILGAEKIRDFGTSLHNISDFKTLLKKSFSSLKWLGIVLKQLYIRDSDSKPDDSEIKTVLWLWYISGMLGMGLCIFLYSSFISESAGIDVLVCGIPFLVAFSISISVVVTFLFFSLGSLLLAFIDFLFIEPLAWILERESLDKIVKVLSLFLLLLGAFFDMLAS